MRKPLAWFVEIVVVVLTICNLVHVFEKPAPTNSDAFSTRSEFILDLHRAGDIVDGHALVSMYDSTYVISLLLSFIVYTTLGSVVLRLRPNDPSAKAFHLLMWSTAALIGLTWTVRDGTWMDVVLRGSSVVAHAMFAAALVRFSATFPQRRTSQVVPQIFSVAALVCGLAGFATMIAIVQGIGAADSAVDMHMAVHQFTQLTMTVIAAVVSVYFFLDTFRATTNARSQRQVLWVFLGLAFSMVSYVGLWILPRALLGNPLIPEYSLLLLACIAPLTFTIAILRYRLLDITVILQRSFVTAIVGALLFAVLYGIHQATIKLIGVNGRTIEFIISVVVLLVLGRYYEPIKKSLQRWIDVRMFKIKYDYRSTVQKFETELRSQLTLSEVYNYVLAILDETVGPKRSAIMIHDKRTDHLRSEAERNFAILRNRSIPYDSLAVKATLRIPIILQGHFEQGVTCELADTEVFTRWDITCVQPLIGGKDDLVGFIVIGQKTNTPQFSIEDADLLRTLASQSALAIERLRFHEAMLISAEESRRLQELSDMKTTFVSAISHDLKVPLTAIKLMAELSVPPQTFEQNKKRMEIIIGESDRLTNLIDNVLTYARLEKGALNPEQEPIEINDIVSQTLHALQYQTESLGFTIATTLASEPLVISADNIHLLIVLQNIVSNAMKYSGTSRNIEVYTKRDGNSAIIEVVDHGIGIANDELERIFAPFERASSVVKSHIVPGTGLGLAIVSELVRRNHGTTHVTSTIDVGSTFSISFPISEGYS